MQYITLNNGMRMPIIGLGTWKSDPGKVSKAVKYAIQEAGYKHIDCAAIYGNEKEIGNALNEVCREGTKREEIFITSKLWNTEHHPDRVEKACRKTLEGLQLDYLDLYLMHWGIAFEPGGEAEPLDKNGVAKTERVSIRETWEAMEALINKGLVKSIGVSNFTPPMLVDLLTYANIKPAVNQIELHPYNSQKDVVKFCKYKGIELTAYSPLGNPSLAGKTQIMLSTEILEIAKKSKKTPAQVLLRWAIQRGIIAIPKSTTLERIKENIDIFDFELSQDEMKKIESLDKGHRFVNPVEWWGVPYFD